MLQQHYLILQYEETKQFEGDEVEPEAPAAKTMRMTEETPTEQGQKCWTGQTNLN